MDYGFIYVTAIQNYQNLTADSESASSKTSIYTNFHRILKFFEILFRYNVSIIFYFKNLTVYLKSATQKLGAYEFSWKLNKYQNFQPYYFLISDRGFVISISENPHIQIYIKLENFSKFRFAILDPPFWI